MLNFLYKNHFFFENFCLNKGKVDILQIQFESGRVRIVWEISVSVLPLFNFIDFNDLCGAFIEKFWEFDISGMKFFLYQICVFCTNRRFVNGLANLFASGRLSFTFLDLGHRGHSVGKRTRILCFSRRDLFKVIKTIIKRPTNDHLWRDFSGLDQEASSLSKFFVTSYLLYLVTP